MGAPGGGPSTLLLPFRCPQRVVTSRCSVSGVASGQPSTEPNCWQAGPKPSCRNAGIPSTRSVKPFRGGRRTTMLRRCGTMGRLTSESARSGSLQDQVREGCAAAVSDPFRPGCFASLSYTLRGCFCGSHARTGSWATFDFPQNSFVWEI